MARKGKDKSVAEKQNMLMVEGKDDQHLIWGLLTFRKFPEKTFDILIGGKEDAQTSGYTEMRDYLPVIIKRGDFKRLGIVVDADENVAGRWMSLRTLLMGLGYSAVPEIPDEMGTIVMPDNQESLDYAEEPYRTRVGLWLMPDNTLPGALEEFVSLLVPPEKSSTWDHAEACVANLPQKPETLTENWKAKARIHSFLAWQDTPGTPMGAAINRRFLDGNSPSATPFLNWIKRLYELP